MGDKRGHRRFEPRFLKATLTVEGTEQEFQGNIIDTSEESIAVCIEKELNTKPDNLIRIKVKDTRHNNSLNLGKAEVVRLWKTPKFLENKPAVAFKLHDPLTEFEKKQVLLRGIPKHERFASQANLAKFDIEYLGSYRGSLIDCQMKLFMLVLTTGVALGSAYFGLTYHSYITNNINNSNLSFWRAMIAALPGLLSMGSALMVAQKSISIQRIDAYLSILKECYLSKRFPREYKGWESEYRKFRRILNTDKCDICNPKCGKIYTQPNSGSKISKLFSNPPPDYYHIIIYSAFLSVISLSIIAIITEIVKYQDRDLLKMSVSVFISTILLATIIRLLFIFKELRYGQYSIEYFRKTWCELMNKCNITNIEF